MPSLRTIPFVMAFALAGCVEQEPSRPTEEDVKIIKENILEKAPAMKFKVNADLEGKVTYLGVDIDKDLVKPGEPFKLTHYWKVVKPLDEGWEIFVHLNGPNKAGFINVDHRAIGGRYPAARWKAGEIIRDEHTVSIPANWKEGATVSIYTGLWKGHLRLKVKGPQDSENRVLAATLPVGTAAAGSTAQPAETAKRLVALKVKRPLKVDGKLDEDAWKKAASTGLFLETMTGAAAPIKTEAKVAWDAKYLYVAFENQDEDVWTSKKNRDDQLWTEETVEMFIDADGDGKDYVELQVNPVNAIFDTFMPSYRARQDDWNSKMKTAVDVQGTLNQRKDKDKSWTVEVAIPWDDVKGRSKTKLKLPPKVGDTFRVNFFRLDLPEGKPQLAAGWSPPLVGDFHKLDRFGQLVFGDEDGKAPEAAPAPKPEEKKAEEKKPEEKAAATPGESGGLKSGAKEMIPALLKAHRAGAEGRAARREPVAKEPPKPAKKPAEGQ